MADARASSSSVPAENWLAFLLTGILTLLLGVAAIAGPHIVTFAINFVLGTLLLVGGLSESSAPCATASVRAGGGRS